MRFTHYMQYFLDLEGGKLIPVSMIFWRPMCNFSRGVLITIYSISWWWWLANRVCPYSIFDLRIWNLGRGFLLRLFCPEPLFDKFWWYFCSQDRRFLSSLRRGKSSPTVRSSPGPGRCRPPPSAAHQPRRATWAPPPPVHLRAPSPEPSIIHLTPDRPLLRLPTGI